MKQNQGEEGRKIVSSYYLFQITHVEPLHTGEEGKVAFARVFQVGRLAHPEVKIEEEN